MRRSSSSATEQRHPPSSETAALRRGFTIVELVVAIAVAGIVVVTVSTALSRIGKTRDVARTRLDAVTRANAALDAVRRDLISTVRDGDLFYTRVLLFDGTTFTPYGAMDRDEIVVFNNRLRPMQRDEYAGEGGEYESQYRIEDDREGSVLWMRRDAVPDENGEGGGMAIPSVEGVVGLQIEAYDGEAWYPDWDSDIFGLPWALRVTVTATGESADNPSSEPELSLVTLRTQIPLDRIVPPPPPPEESEEEAKDGAAGEDPAAAGANGEGDPNADGAAGGGAAVGGGRGPGGLGGAGLDGGGGMGGGRRPGGGRGPGGVEGIDGGFGGGGGISVRPNNNRPGRGRGQTGSATMSGGSRGGFSMGSRQNR
jgi:type II secretion system protein J